MYIDKKESHVPDYNPTPDPPWRGNDWHPFPVAAELLDTKRITWSDITHVLYATGSLCPGHMFKVVWAIISAARQSHLSPKKVVNSLLGTWLISKSLKYQCHTSTNRLDVVHLAKERGGYLSQARVQDRVVWDLVIKTEQLTCASCPGIRAYVSEPPVSHRRNGPDVPVARIEHRLLRVLYP